MRKILEIFKRKSRHGRAKKRADLISHRQDNVEQIVILIKARALFFAELTNIIKVCVRFHCQCVNIVQEEFLVLHSDKDTTPNADCIGSAIRQPSIFFEAEMKR